ncbi:MAG: hypothetical protein ACJ8DE_19915 [Microvirga sp.]
MISVETYLLFVAPFLMGAAGLMIYLIALYFMRASQPSSPDSKPQP